MSTQQKSAAVAEPAQPVPVTPLEQGRVRLVGETVQHDAVIVVRTREEVDDLLRRPLEYLRFSQEAVATLTPGSKVRLISDDSSRYCEAVVVGCRGNKGSGIIMIDLAPLPGTRVDLRPALPPQNVAGGWTMAYEGAHLQWVVRHNGAIRHQNLITEDAARNALNRETNNSAQRR
jgi:hypothetical protein